MFKFHTQVQSVNKKYLKKLNQSSQKFVKMHTYTHIARFHENTFSTCGDKTQGQTGKKLPNSLFTLCNKHKIIAYTLTQRKQAILRKGDMKSIFCDVLITLSNIICINLILIYYLIDSSIMLMIVRQSLKFSSTNKFHENRCS
jgi:hypothetical protein